VIVKATNTHSEYVILIAFARQQWLRERATILRFTARSVLYRQGFLRHVDCVRLSRECLGEGIQPTVWLHNLVQPNRTPPPPKPFVWLSIDIRSSTSLRDRDSSVGIAPRYGLDGPVIEFRWGGGRFSAPVPTGPGAHSASCTRGTRGIAAGAWRSPTTPSRAEVKERVEPYLCSPSGPSLPVLGWPLPLPDLFTAWQKGCSFS
jgi:hypothetical protein